MMTFLQWIEGLATRGEGPGTDHRLLVGCEGLLLPDTPGVPGASKINTSLFPRSRYRINPTLRLLKPRLRLPPKPGLPTPPKLGP